MTQVGGLTFPAAAWAESPLGEHDGTVLRVVARYDPPFLSWVRRENATEHVGFLMDVWRLIASELHLHYEFTGAQPKEFGNLLANGSWTGVVGELATDRADVGLSWLSYSNQRAREVEFIDAIPVGMEAYNFYVMEGSSDRIRLRADMFARLTLPLHTNVWLMLLASLLVVSLALRLTIRFSGPSSETPRTRREFDLGTCHLHVFMSVMGQGWPTTPDSLAARIVTLSGWMLGLLIYVNYTANLISYLAVTTVNKPISSLQEFLAEPDWKLAAEGGLNAFQDWQESADEDYRRLYQLLSSQRYILLESSAESSRQCLQPKVLCFQELSRLFYFLNREACALQPLLQTEPHKSRAYLVLREGLGAVRRAANKVLQKVNQSGALQRLRAQWFRSSAAACSASVVFTPLSLPELFAVLVIVPLACLVSGVMLGAELAVSRRSVPADPGPALRLTERGRQRRVSTEAALSAGRGWSAEGAATAMPKLPKIRWNYAVSPRPAQSGSIYGATKRSAKVGQRYP